MTPIFPSPSDPVSERITYLEAKVESLTLQLEKILQLLQPQDQDRSASQCSVSTISSNSSPTLNNEYEETLLSFRALYEHTQQALNEAHLDDDDAWNEVFREKHTFDNFEPSLKSIADGKKSASVDTMKEGIQVMELLLEALEDASAIINGKQCGLSMDEIRYNIDVARREPEVKVAPPKTPPSKPLSANNQDLQQHQNPLTPPITPKGKEKMSPEDVSRLQIVKDQEAALAYELADFDANMDNTHFSAEKRAHCQQMLSSIPSQRSNLSKQFVSEFKVLRQIVIDYLTSPYTRLRMQRSDAWPQFWEEEKRFEALDGQLRALIQSGTARNDAVEELLISLHHVLFAILERVTSFQIAYRVLDTIVKLRPMSLKWEELYARARQWLHFTHPLQDPSTPFSSPVPNPYKRGYSEVERNSSASTRPDSDETRYSPRPRCESDTQASDSLTQDMWANTLQFNSFETAKQGIERQMLKEKRRL